MKSAQIIEKSVTNNNYFHNYPYSDNHTRLQTTDTLGFKPFTTIDYLLAFNWRDIR